MSKPKAKSDTVKVSRLGCMRKSTIISSDDSRTVEHVELWVPEASEKPAPAINASQRKQRGKKR